MSAPLDSSGLQQLLGQAMQALGQARGAGADGSEGAAPDAEPIQGHGEGADGLIRVTAETGGQLSAIELDPRVMRMSTVDLGTELVEAVNAALADLQNRIRDAIAMPDLDNLADQLKEVQEQSTRQMGNFLQALTDVQDRIASSGGR